MDLSQIISIAGKSGLYKILNQSRGGVIVTSLSDGKKTAIGQTQRVSALSDISVYTLDGDILLHEILKRIYDKTSGKPVEIDIKDDAVIRDFFAEAVPEHDDERVYHSDIRKIIKWYNNLLEKDMLDFSEEESEEKAEEAEASIPETTASSTEDAKAEGKKSE
jgi:hypothetical protein